MDLLKVDGQGGWSKLMERVVRKSGGGKLICARRKTIFIYQSYHSSV